MSNFARVESLDVLKQFRASLCKFSEAAGLALSEAGGDLNRTIRWLKQDQHRYWEREVHKRSEQFLRAKLDLERKRYYEKSPLGGRASCVDEKKAFAAAKRRLEEAEEKMGNVRRWVPKLEKEAFTYQGATQGLTGDLEIKLPNALARLDNMIMAIEAYLEIRTPAEGGMKAGEGEEIAVISKPEGSAETDTENGSKTIKVKTQESI